MDSRSVGAESGTARQIPPLPDLLVQPGTSVVYHKSKGFSVELASRIASGMLRATSLRCMTVNGRCFPSGLQLEVAILGKLRDP